MPRPELRCCTPTHAPFPSGWRRVHSRYCTTSPGMKVKEADYTEVIEMQREPVSHPAGAALPVGGVTSARIARRHNLACTCAHCLYVGFWQDRDDDLTLEARR